ncbi:MAG TPA: lytic murein transglycosylase [Methylocystis sp.]|nr:lytic murein transglycosylase [Methylocystis sp.]
MMKRLKLKILAVSALAALAMTTDETSAASCGSGPGGFERWKQEFIAENRSGHSQTALAALQSTHYNSPTIGADRGQHSFHLSLDAFMAKRGANAIVAGGRQRKRSMAGLFQSIESRYGVPPGPLLAIWGMETGFGAVSGNQHALSAIATLAYDCRRSEYFTEQLDAFLTLIDHGAVSPSARGSMHGEIGQTQFLPKNILHYGAGGNLDSAGPALMATANFLQAHGWRAGGGYQPGESNFGAIQAWNAAQVYEHAIAIIGRRIDTGE